MNTLLSCFNSMNKISRKTFLSDVGISEGYLRRACSTGVKMSAERCVAIEKATNGQVSRKDLRPDDWEKIWPELA